MLATESLSVVVGAHALPGKNTASQRRHSIQQVVAHEKYFTEKPRNDIMLLRLNPAIEYSENVRPICVDKSVFPTRMRCYVTGWGNTVTQGK